MRRLDTTTWGLGAGTVALEVRTLLKGEDLVGVFVILASLAIEWRGTLLGVEMKNASMFLVALRRWVHESHHSITRAGGTN